MPSKGGSKAEVVKVLLQSHENADTLSIIRINDFTVVVKTEEWKDGDLGVYLLPDTCLNTEDPLFQGIRTKGHGRITAQKIRGIISYGLLIKCPFPDAKEGDDVAEKLDIRHYDPEEMTHEKKFKGVRLFCEKAEKAPPFLHKYDVENLLTYGKKVFEEGEEVVVVEKLEGCCSRYVFKDSNFFCGSRNEWKREYPKLACSEEDYKKVYPFGTKYLTERNLWWKVFMSDPSIKHFCEEYPEYEIYGEVYGQVKDFPYDTKEPNFRAFDIRKPDGSWLNFNDFFHACINCGVKIAPIVKTCIPYNLETIMELAGGNSLIGNHIKEGVVVRPLIEKWHPSCGRVLLKVKNPEYLLKGK
jgi:RNA ligase (TIGR02306 family)